MKKISKFRVWLIRKLGGEIPVPTIPIIVEKTPPSVKLESKETAEKFAEMVSKAFIGLNCIDIDEWNWCQRKIDEICKGLTEGKV